MNWKDAPHLFCNGKFETSATVLVNANKPYPTTLTPKKLGKLQSMGKVSECTLIARPISDMTDEEVIDIGRGLPSDDVRSQWAKYERERLIKEAKNDKISFREARKILSIGVYCLSDTTDVIFKPKTEQP